MTATHTFDVFSSVEGPVAAGDWTSYWGKQGPELLDHRLRLVDAKQRMVFGPADADVVSGDAVDVVARLKQDSDRAKTGVFADSHPELGWLASKIHRAAAVRDWLDGCPHDASDPGGVRHERGGNGYCRRSGEIPMYRRTSIRTALAAACRMAENPPPGKDPSWERS